LFGDVSHLLPNSRLKRAIVLNWARYAELTAADCPQLADKYLAAYMAKPTATDTANEPKPQPRDSKGRFCKKA